MENNNLKIQEINDPYKIYIIDNFLQEKALFVKKQEDSDAVEKMGKERAEIADAPDLPQ